MLKIEDTMTVKAYIDAAYGVHQNTGKSHTGCAIVLGNAGRIRAGAVQTSKRYYEVVIRL